MPANGHPPTADPNFPQESTLALDDGRTFTLRDSGAPRDRQNRCDIPLVLVHGWLATADLNWAFSIPTLTPHFRVLSFDQPGHGKGTVDHRRFSFPQCAEDLQAVLDACDVKQAIVVGYSMGGPIALTFARQHAARCAGLVLCATAATFTTRPIKRSVYGLLSPIVNATRLIPESPVRASARRRFVERRASGAHAEWIADQIAPSNLTMLAQAGIEIARFDAQSWLSQIAVPSAVVITTDDELVPREAQEALARALPDARPFRIAGGHTACFDRPAPFAETLRDACKSVATRSGDSQDLARTIRSGGYG